MAAAPRSSRDARGCGGDRVVEAGLRQYARVNHRGLASGWSLQKLETRVRVPPLSGWGVQRRSKAMRPVMVTTQYRGVFFGYADDTNWDRIKLKKCRNCVYWPASQKGFLGLAANGPCSECRIGPPADEVELRGITAVIEVSPEAVAKWEAAPWSK